jgi:hypothetical protein
MNCELFGMREKQKRENGTRERGEKLNTSPVWYVREIEKRPKRGGSLTFLLLCCYEKKWPKNY